MENRPLSVVAGLIALLALPVAVQAADDALSAEQQARLAKAATLLAEGEARQTEADKRLIEKNAECATKFLINDCRNAAAREHLKVTRETRRRAHEGKTIEREVKREQMLARDRQDAAEGPKRAADLELRQAESMNARQLSEQRIAARQVAKAAKATDGEKRKVAEAKRQHRKQAEHDARVARKMREAKERAAQATEKK